MMTAYHVSVPMRVGFAHARAARKWTDNVLVELKLPDGRVGWGEGVPREYVTGETVESVMQWLRDFDLAALSRFRGLSFADVAWDLHRTSSASWGPWGPSESPAHSAMCAMELALLDAAARAENRSIGDVIDVLPELHPLRGAAPVESLRVTIPVGKDSGWVVPLLKRLRPAERYDVKVKVGFGVRDDVERLTEVRRALGDGADIRVDANGAWSPSLARESLTAMKPLDVSAVEEPVAGKSLDDAAWLRRAIAIPVILDESICSLADARAAHAANAVDTINLRVSKCAGVIETLRIARFAKDVGLGCQLGCMVGETGILSAVERVLARRLDGLRYLETACDTLFENIVAEPITADSARRTSAPSGPGIGVTVVSERVAKYTVSSFSREGP